MIPACGRFQAIEAAAKRPPVHVAPPAPPAPPVPPVPAVAPPLPLVPAIAPPPPPPPPPSGDELTACDAHAAGNSPKSRLAGWRARRHAVRGPTLTICMRNSARVELPE